jgi:diguanylate cyclase (GGDEF)-like protein/PAS domain S-box-containing protein
MTKSSRNQGKNQQLTNQSGQLALSNSADNSKQNASLDAKELLHELQVHQIDLENQNEELRKTRSELDSALERYTQLYDFAPIAFFTLDANSRIIHANHAAAKLLGIPRSAIYRHRFIEWVSAESQQEFLNYLEQTLITKHYEINEFTLQLEDRSIIITIEANAQSNDQYCQAIVADITQRKQYEHELRLAAMVYMAIGEAILVADANNRILAVNPAFTQLTGYTEQEVIGQSTNLLKSGRHDQEFYQRLWSVLLETGHWQGEIWNKRKNGEIYLEWLRIDTCKDKNGNVQHRVAVFSDITERKQVEEFIWTQANFDPLTGLPNRRMFQERLQIAIKQAHRDNHPMALLFLDLDRFKEVNDTLGHDIGDNMLKEVAKRLKECVRETDTVARLGGDEFTVILGDLDDPGSIDRVAQCILEHMRQPFLLAGETAYISISIGITIYPEDTANMTELLVNADQAMYAAKEAGRNRFCYFTRSMQESIEHRVHLTNDLRTALADQQFLLNYQPIVELASGEIHKAEALIRWQHPQLGLISPAGFIAIAEETGLIVEIGDWVFRKAAQQVKQWRTNFDPQFQVSLNKSAVQFRHENGMYNWPEYLQEIDLSGTGIAVEITENLLLNISADISNKLFSIHHANMQIALDDFGTGYSSLPSLKSFGIDYLKIDQSFVSKLGFTPTDLALCEAVIVMAHKLGMKVIAEGIEMAEQRDLLLAAGCDFGQGFLFSKPATALEFEKNLWSKD